MPKMPRDNIVVCPRCGSKMVYVIEIEGSNSKTIRYYYRCPVCGYKLEDLSLTVRRSGNGGVEIEALEAKKRLVYPLNIVKR